jgi:hypothetical protein
MPRGDLRLGDCCESEKGSAEGCNEEGDQEGSTEDETRHRCLIRRISLRLSPNNQPATRQEEAIYFGDFILNINI